MNTSPFIELVICTYNNAGLLEKTLSAISNQVVYSDVEWRVLVVDNNCTDDTQEVVQRHQHSGKIPGLYIITEKRQGLTAARQCGVRHTSAKWIAFVDDDCFLAEDWVEQAIRFARAHPDCGAFGGQVILDWEVTPPKYVKKYGYSFAQQKGKTLQKKDCVVGAGMVVNRKALADTGWINKPMLQDRTGQQLISGGDVEIGLRIFGAGYEIWFTPDCKINHFIPARRTTQQYLVDINYGLGSCQILADTIVWKGSYPGWCMKFIWDALKSSKDTRLQGLRSLLGRMNAAEVEINKSFAKGKWAGIRRVMRMDKKERRSLIGCAVLNKTGLSMEKEKGLDRNPAPF